jgi:hypothetical protein
MMNAEEIIGDDNAIGNNTTGSQNTAIGADALATNTTGSFNTALGDAADVSSANLSNATAIGYGAVVNASNKVVIGNSSVTSIGGYVGWSNFSDGRFKRNIREDVPGLAFIRKLRPVTYTLDFDAIDAFRQARTADDKHRTSDVQQATAISGRSVRTYTGFLAQEVEQAASQLNYRFSGVDRPQDPSTQTYALRYSEFVVPLVKAIQEQQAMIEQLQKEVEELKQSKH